MALEFSLGTGRAMTLPEVAHETKVAEDLGYSQITLVDQPDLDRDVYMLMDETARATSRVKIGHGVTVPGLRHPSVAANMVTCVNETSNGRAFLGIGSGWTAYTTKSGKGMGKLKELRDFVTFFRSYARGEEAEYDGSTMHSEWMQAEIPVYMAAAGPKSCQLAGELADGVILGPGANPEVVKWRLEHVAKGAERAGRNMDEIDTWVRTFILPAESRDAARREASAYGSLTCGLTLGLKGPDGDELRRRLQRRIPALPKLLEDARIAYTAYDPYQHERLDSPHSQLVTQEMIDFMHLTGPPDEICAQISELEQIGVKNVSGVVFTCADRMKTMRDIADEIMPRFTE